MGMEGGACFLFAVYFAAYASFIHLRLQMGCFVFFFSIRIS